MRPRLAASSLRTKAGRAAAGVKGSIERAKTPKVAPEEISKGPTSSTTTTTRTKRTPPKKDNVGGKYTGCGSNFLWRWPMLYIMYPILQCQSD